MGKRKLNWEYDESGTKCFVTSAAGIHFSLFLSLEPGNDLPYYLDRGFGQRIGRYETWEEADAAAWAIVEPVAKKLKAELEALGI